ncbi:MAG: aminopeptidase [Pseudomonadota bacterium]
MADPRTDRLAAILVGYSLKVKEGETVLISCTEAGKPLGLVVFEEVLRNGGHPLLEVGFEEADAILLNQGSMEQVRHLSPVRLYQAQHIDCYVNIRAPLNRKLLSGVPAERVSARQAALKPWKDIVIDEKRWVLTNFPTNALAQEAEMSLAEYEDFFYRATNIDWEAVDREEERLKLLLESSRSVRILGRETDLRFSIEGRKAAKCSGQSNMPDGEVFTAPVEDSTEGTIYYEFPAIYNAREVTGVRLTFKGGRVVDASAEKNADFLHSMLDMDAGSRRIGEFGVGFNYAIERFTKDTLFDEKIGGTIHLALGKGYPETGSLNDSALHWDMIKDLRQGGEIHLDSTPIQKDGRFLWP